MRPICPLKIYSEGWGDDSVRKAPATPHEDLSLNTEAGHSSTTDRKMGNRDKRTPRSL